MSTADLRITYADENPWDFVPAQETEFGTVPDAFETTVHVRIRFDRGAVDRLVAAGDIARLREFVGLEVRVPPHAVEALTADLTQRLVEISEELG